ncbi:MAG: hypothetical protein ACOYO1_07260 [Bacteroidales bacterium]
MKKISFYIIIFVGIAINAFSQTKSKNVDIIFGEEIKEARSSSLESILGYDETGIYVLKTEGGGAFSSGQDCFIEHFDNNMNQTKSEELIIEDKNGEERDYEFIVHMNNTLYVFSSIENKKTDKVWLYAQTISKKTLRPNNDSRKIAEINYAEKGSGSFGDFEYNISKDQTKLMIHYLLPAKKKEKEKIAIIVLDKDLGLLWEKKCTLPYLEELFNDERYRIDNDGNAYILGVVYKEKAMAKRKGKPNYKYQLICYKDKGETYKEYPIDLPGKFITDMQIAINDKNDIVCGGFYSKIGTFSIDGSYYLNIDGDNGEILSKSFKEFDLEFITQNMTEREANKVKRKEDKGKDVELFEYDLDNIILRDDGGAILVGEQFFVEVYTYTSSNGATTTSYHYNYNDIIVININPEGKIEWAKKIPKVQESVNDGGTYSSYAMSVFGDKLFFIFNDNPKNLTNEGDGKLKNYNPNRESIVAMVNMDGDGKFKKEALYKMKRSDILIRPKLSKQISDDEMIIFGKKGKMQQFTKLIYK